MLITHNLEQTVLINPFRSGCDQLKVLSGYVSATMVSRHLHRTMRMARSMRGISPPIVDAIYGMAKPSGITAADHQGFLRMQSQTYRGRFSCSYLVDRPAVHAKIYVWLQDRRPQIAFMGSASYTQAGFVFEPDRMEAIEECDPEAALDIYEECFQRSVECSHASVEDEIVIRRDGPISEPSSERVRLSFLIERGRGAGETPRAAGINWGFRLNQTRRNHNEAYLRVPSEIASSDFFPATGVHFTVITDDDQQMICVVAQDGRKAIETPESNAILGGYFRDRMGISEQRRINAADFETYGRDDVTIIRIDQETYYVDFGVRD